MEKFSRRLNTVTRQRVGAQGDIDVATAEKQRTSRSEQGYLALQQCSHFRRQNDMGLDAGFPRPWSGAGMFAKDKAVRLEVIENRRKRPTEVPQRRKTDQQSTLFQVNPG